MFFYFLFLSASEGGEPEDLQSRLLVGWENDDKGRRKVRISIPNSENEIRCTVINGDDLVGIGTGSTARPAIKEYDGKLVIPSKFKFLRKDFYVRSIRKYAFYKSSITEISFPPEIESIEPFSFCGCSIKEDVDLSKTKITEIPNCSFYDARVRSVILPNSVTKIGDQAFSTSKITNFVFPESLSEMLPAAFRMCENLMSVDMSKTKMRVIPERTFERCLALSKVTFPLVIDQLCEGCFFSCTAIEEIDLSKYHLKEIGNFAFYNCFCLKKIIFPPQLEKLGSGCLGSTKLGVIEFPESLSYIGDNAFKFCIEIHDINLVETSIKAIPKAAFAKCPSLQSVMLPDSVETIGEEAFYMCLALTSIDMSETNVKVIGKSAFQSCPSLSKVILSPILARVEQMAFAQCEITKFTAPSTVSFIGQECFFRSISLETVDLSKSSVLVLDALSFYDCRSLSKIILPSSLEEIGQACLAWCSFTELIIPSTVTKIGHMFLANCYNLKELDLSNTLIKELPYGAFSNCQKLTRIVFPSAMTGFCDIPSKIEIFSPDEIIDPKNWQEEKQKITKSLAPLSFLSQLALEEHSSFYNCKELLSVDLSSTSMKIIPDWTFLNCSGLINVHLPPTIELIGDGAFRGTQVGDVVIPKNVREIGQYAYAFNTKLVSIDLSKATITTLQEGTFFGCSQLAAIKYPKNLEAIQLACFKGTAFSKIILPDTVNELGKYAFSDNDELVGIDLLITTIQKIREGAFSRCSHLSSVIFPKSLRALGSAAFAGCIVQELFFPPTMTTINNAAFAYCSRLRIALLEETKLRVLRASVFEGCSSLAKVTLPSTLNDIGDQCFLHCSLLGEITYFGQSDLNSKQVLPRDIKFTLSPNYNGIRFLGFEIMQDKKKGCFRIRTRSD